VPICLDGTIPSVLGDCYGPCLPPTECREVTDCSDCTAGSVCVRHELQPAVTGCAVPAAGCHQGSYCQCLGVCDASLPVCSESMNGGVACACPNCGSGT
jgi:hypothetical protein